MPLHISYISAQESIYLLDPAQQLQIAVLLHKLNNRVVLGLHIVQLLILTLNALKMLFELSPLSLVFPLEIQVQLVHSVL